MQTVNTLVERSSSSSSSSGRSSPSASNSKQPKQLRTAQRRTEEEEENAKAAAKLPPQKLPSYCESRDPVTLLFGVSPAEASGRLKGAEVYPIEFWYQILLNEQIRGDRAIRNAAKRMIRGTLDTGLAQGAVARLVDGCNRNADGGSGSNNGEGTVVGVGSGELDQIMELQPCIGGQIGCVMVRGSLVVAGRNFANVDDLRAVVLPAVQDTMKMLQQQAKQDGNNDLAAIQFLFERTAVEAPPENSTSSSNNNNIGSNEEDKADSSAALPMPEPSNNDKGNMDSSGMTPLLTTPPTKSPFSSTTTSDPGEKNVDSPSMIDSKPPPLPPPQDPSSTSLTGTANLANSNGIDSNTRLGLIIGFAALGLVIILGILIFVMLRRRKQKDQGKPDAAGYGPDNTIDDDPKVSLADQVDRSSTFPAEDDDSLYGGDNSMVLPLGGIDVLALTKSRDIDGGESEAESERSSTTLRPRRQKDEILSITITKNDSNNNLSGTWE